VLLGLLGRESAVLELDECSPSLTLEAHSQQRRAGRHRVVARFSPRDLDQVRTLDAHEVSSSSGCTK
jgi:hypothetical protein